jgi:predicted Zn-dependent peptidase
MGYSAHRYGGAVTIVVALEPKHLKRAKRELTKYLKQARRLDYSSDDVFGENQLYAMDFMESAKNRIRFRGEQAREQGLAIATSLARYMLLNEIADRGDYLEHIAEINTTDLRGTAGKYLCQKNCVIVTIEPKKKR